LKRATDKDIDGFFKRVFKVRDINNHPAPKALFANRKKKSNPAPLTALFKYELDILYNSYQNLREQKRPESFADYIEDMLDTFRQAAKDKLPPAAEAETTELSWPEMLGHFRVCADSFTESIDAKTDKTSAQPKTVYLSFIPHKNIITFIRFADGAQCCISSNKTMELEGGYEQYMGKVLVDEPTVVILVHSENTPLGFILGHLSIDDKGDIVFASLRLYIKRDYHNSTAVENIWQRAEQILSYLYISQIGQSTKSFGLAQNPPDGYEQTTLTLSRLQTVPGNITTVDLNELTANQEVEASLHVKEVPTASAPALEEFSYDNGGRSASSPVELVRYYGVKLQEAIGPILDELKDLHRALSVQKPLSDQTKDKLTMLDEETRRIHANISEIRECLYRDEEQETIPNKRILLSALNKTIVDAINNPIGIITSTITWLKMANELDIAGIERIGLAIESMSKAIEGLISVQDIRLDSNLGFFKIPGFKDNYHFPKSMTSFTAEIETIDPADPARSSRQLRAGERDAIIRQLREEEVRFSEFPAVRWQDIEPIIKALRKEGFSDLAKGLKTIAKQENVRFAPIDFFVDLEERCLAISEKRVVIFALSHIDRKNKEYILINPHHLDELAMLVVHEVTALTLRKYGVSYKETHRYASKVESVVSARALPHQRKDLQDKFKLFSRSQRIVVLDGLVFEGYDGYNQGIILEAKDGVMYILSVGHSAQKGREVNVYINSSIALRGDIIASKNDESDISLVRVINVLQDFYFEPLAVGYPLMKNKFTVHVPFINCRRFLSPKIAYKYKCHVFAFAKRRKPKGKNKGCLAINATGSSLNQWGICGAPVFYKDKLVGLIHSGSLSQRRGYNFCYAATGNTIAGFLRNIRQGQRRRG